MIQELIVTTQNAKGVAHIAPMGVHYRRADNDDCDLIILPFRPSTTLDNLIANSCAVLNACDDVRVFAGCVTGRRDWPLVKAECVNAPVLVDALARFEVVVKQIEDDPIRPKLFCQIVHTVNHKPFLGFNRAQFAVLEAAILVSRLERLPRSKIDAELAYLQIGFDKAAGERELEAWAWLMAAVQEYQEGRQ